MFGDIHVVLCGMQILSIDFVHYPIQKNEFFSSRKSFADPHGFSLQDYRPSQLILLDQIIKARQKNETHALHSQAFDLYQEYIFYFWL